MSKWSMQAGGRRLRGWLWRRAWLRPKTRDEARTLVRGLNGEDLLDDSLCEMLEGAFNISSLCAADIMIPRADMKVVSIEASRQDVVAQITECGHSRYPVTDSDRSDVVGILLAKDVLTRTAAGPGQPEFSIKGMMLPPQRFPESRRLSDLLRDFQATHSHMGIIMNEYSEAAGLVTIEDVLEEIVGEIADEHDRHQDSESERIRTVDKARGRYAIVPTVPVDEFNQHFNAAFDAEAHATIGGLVLQRIGHFPAVNEQVEIEGFRFTVARVSGQRIRLLDLEAPASGT